MEEMTVDGAGNIYLAGRYKAWATFGSTTLMAAGGGQDWDMFIAQADKTGKVTWARSAGSSGSNNPDGVIHGLALGPGGDLHVIGTFVGKTSFGMTTLQAHGSDDIFVAKLSPSGSWRWVKQLGSKGYDWGFDVAVDKGGDLIICGEHNAYVREGPHLLDPAGGTFEGGIFVARLSSGGIVKWWRTFWGLAGGWAQLREVALAGNGDILLASVLSRGIWLQSKPLYEGLKGMAAFLVRLDSAGKRKWALVGGGTSWRVNDTWVTDLAVDGQGDAYLAGEYDLQMSDVFTMGGLNLSYICSNVNNGFLVRVDPTGKVTRGAPMTNSSTDLKIHDIALDGQGGVLVSGNNGKYSSNGAVWRMGL